MEQKSGGVNESSEDSGLKQGSNEGSEENMHSSLPSDEHIPSENSSKDLNRPVVASNSSQSFGARFNNIPEPISVQKSNMNAMPTRGPMLGTFRIQNSSGPPGSQNLCHSQGQASDLESKSPEWRQLPLPHQTGQPSQSSKLVRLPPLSNIINKVGPERHPRLVHSQSQQNGHSGVSCNAVARSQTLHGTSLGGIHNQRLDDVRFSNPYTSVMDIPHSTRGTKSVGSIIIHSNPSGQEHVGEHARLVQTRPRSLAANTSGNPFPPTSRTAEQEQAMLRKAYHQFKREQAENAALRLKQQNQHDMGQEPTPQHHAHGSLHMQGPTVFPTNHGYHQTQALSNLSGRNNMHPYPVGNFNQTSSSLAPGLNIPGNSPLTPSFLDPTLIPQTYDAVILRYQKNKDVINHWAWENERYLAAWSAQFKNRSEASTVNSPLHSPNITTRLGLFPPSNQGTMQENHLHAPRNIASQVQESAREPMPPPMAMQTPGLVAPSGPYFVNTEAMHDRSKGPHAGTRQEPARSGSSLRMVENVQPSPPKAHRKRKLVEASCSLKAHKTAEEKGNKIHSLKQPKQKGTDTFPANNEKRGSPKKSELSALKSDTNDDSLMGDESAQTGMPPFADEIAAANLPPPTISDAALRAAGITPKGKAKMKATSNFLGPLKTPSTGRNRSKKEQFPAGGIRVPQSLRTALLAGGAKEITQNTPQMSNEAAENADSNSVNTSYASTAPPLEQGASENMVGPNRAADDSMSSARFSESALRSSISKMKDDRIANRKGKHELLNPSLSKILEERKSRSPPDGLEDPKNADDIIGASGGPKALMSQAVAVTKSRSTRNTSTSRKISMVPSKRAHSIASSDEEDRPLKDAKLKDN